MKSFRKKNLALLGHSLIAGIGIVLGTGCASAPTEGNGLDPNQESLLQRHRQALSTKTTQPAPSCKTFQNLANSETYILKELAVLQAGTTCPDLKSIPAITTAEESVISRSPWLSIVNLERKAHIASLRNDQSDPALRELLNAYVNQVQATDSVTEKLKLLQDLKIQVASDLGLTEDVQNRIYQLSPRTNPAPKDLNKAAQDAFKNQDYELGRELLEKIFDNILLSFSERIQARKTYRNSFRIEREFDDYYEDCKEYANWIKKNFWANHNFDWKIFFESQFALSKAAYMVGQIDEAEQILKRSAGTIKGRTSLEELFWFRGRLAEERKDYQVALDFFNSSLHEISEKPHFRERVLFSQAWVYRKMKHYKEAANILTGLRDRTKESGDLSRYTYWLGRNLIDFNRIADGKAELARVKIIDPFGFFGVAASFTLKEDLPGLPEANKKVATSLLDLNLRKNIAAFSLANEDRVLESYLNLKLKNTKALGIETTTFLLEKLGEAEAFNSLINQVNDLDFKMSRNILGTHPEFYFPVSYVNTIKASAGRFQIPPELIYAIVRFHSGFIADAQPATGGAGLAGITEQLGNEYAAAAGVRFHGVEDLYNPETNIKIISARLGALKTTYKNQIFLMGLGIFATPQDIDHWLKAHQGDDVFEFIEDIPLDEFQYNIRTLLRNYIFYCRIQNGELPYRISSELFQVKNP